MEGWRQCLLISSQLQDAASLHHLLCDVDEWPVNDAFRADVTVRPHGARELV